MKAIKECRTYFFGAIASFAVGIILFFTPLIPLALAAVGGAIGIFRMGVVKLRKYKEYIVCVDAGGNTELEKICIATGREEKKVVRDLQDMIERGFFLDEKNGVNALIIRDLDLVVMMKYPEGVPLEPIQKTINRELYEKRKKESEIGLDVIRRVIRQTEDEDISSCLYELDASIRRIYRMIERDRSLNEQSYIRKLKNQYMPQLLKIIQRLEHGTCTAKMKAEIKDVLATSVIAFENIESNILERDAFETRIDIEALEKTLAIEGLLDDVKRQPKKPERKVKRAQEEKAARKHLTRKDA